MAWNVSTDLVKGDNLLLYLVSGDTVNTGSSKVLAYATSCSVQIDSESIDTSSKFSCKWNSNMGGRAGYTISADALYCQASSASGNNAVSFDVLMELMVAGNPVNWVIGQEAVFTGDCKDNTHVLDVSKPYYYGSAAITSLSLEAGNNEIATCSISMSGNGPISKHTS